MIENVNKCGKLLPAGYACGRRDGHKGPCGDPWKPGADGHSVSGKLLGHGVLLGVPENLRFSTAVLALRRLGNEAGAQELERDQRNHGSVCATHGKLDDPIIVLTQERVMFGCPWCSGPEMLAAWEKEGMRS